MIRSRRSCGVALLLLWVSCAAACGGNDEEQKPLRPKPEAPLAPVNIPEVPADLGQVSTPDKNPDGSFTVEGLLRGRMANLRKEVSLTGVVSWVYDCPYDDDDPKDGKKPKPKPKPATPPKEGEPAQELCKRPHFTVGDTADAKVQLLVVGLTPYLEELFTEGKVKVGDKHTFLGTYQDLSDGFAAPDQGLLRVTTIVGLEEVVEDDKKPK